jgi:hypothetical protein
LAPARERELGACKGRCSVRTLEFDRDPGPRRAAAALLMSVWMSACSGDDATQRDMSATSAADAGALDADVVDAVDASAASGCTRANLKNLVELYLQALIAHDPAPLPVSSSVKFTENGAVLGLGEGFWQTAGALQFHRNVLDSEACGAVVQAVFEEQGKQVIFGLRLKLEASELTEIETLVARSGPLPGEAFFMPNVIVTTPQPEWEEAVPVAERSSREELIGIADAYFEGFETSGTPDYKPVPFADDCDRWENGVKTTQMNCAAQFQMTAFGSFGSGITRRRYPVLDVENGIALGFVLFSGIGIDFHMFKVRGGQIHQIQAVVGPFSGSTGWEEYETN